MVPSVLGTKQNQGGSDRESTGDGGPSLFQRNAGQSIVFSSPELKAQGEVL